MRRAIQQKTDHETAIARLAALDTDHATRTELLNGLATFRMAGGTTRQLAVVAKIVASGKATAADLMILEGRI